MLSEVKSSTQVRMRYVAVKKKKKQEYLEYVYMYVLHMLIRKIIGTDLFIEIIDALILVQLTQK